MPVCPNCRITVSKGEIYCSGACREEWRENNLNKPGDAGQGCALASSMFSILCGGLGYMWLHPNSPTIDPIKISEQNLFGYGACGISLLFPVIVILCYLIFEWNGKQERTQQKKIEAETAKRRAADAAKLSADAATVRAAEVAAINRALEATIRTEEAAKKRSKNK